MSRKKLKQIKQASTTMGYVVWCYLDRGIAGDATFGTLNEAKDYVEKGLRNYDFVARDVVICELVERCQPKAPITEVEWKEIK